MTEESDHNPADHRLSVTREHVDLAIGHGHHLPMDVPPKHERAVHILAKCQEGLYVARHHPEGGAAGGELRAPIAISDVTFTVEANNNVITYRWENDTIEGDVVFDATSQKQVEQLINDIRDQEPHHQ